MATARGVLALALMFLCVAPWVRRMYSGPRPSGWDEFKWPLTLGLSPGFVTLAMGALGLWRLDAAVCLAIPAVVLAAGLVLNRVRPDPRPAWSAVGRPSFFSRLLDGHLDAWVAFAALGAGFAVFCQATYYPFVAFDEFRYALGGKVVVSGGAIPESMRGSPPLMSMAYAYVFFLAGTLAEQVAHLVPALLSVATALATAALGVRWYGPRAGPAALFVLVASPLFLRYAPVGFVDIPTGLFFVLTAFTADVWLETRRFPWALLTGVCTGLALWTKQSAFLALAGAGVVFAAAVVIDLRHGEVNGAARAIRDGLVALGTAVAFGGWWYLRNVWYDGWRGVFWTPGALYTSQARTGLAYLVPFIGFGSAFGYVSSAACLVGLAWAVARPRRAVWPLAWAVPYTLVWWRLYSFDARFLLTVLPFYAVLFGGAVAAWKRPVSRLLRLGLGAGAAAVAAIAAIQAGLGGVRQWLVAPRATYAEKLLRVEVGGCYATVAFLRERTPESSRIVTMDSRMPYYLFGRDIRVEYPIRLADLRSVDYLVAAAWGPSIYAGLGAADNEVMRAMSDGTFEKLFAAPRNEFTVYRVRRP